MMTQQDMGCLVLNKCVSFPVPLTFTVYFCCVSIQSIEFLFIKNKAIQLSYFYISSKVVGGCGCL